MPSHLTPAAVQIAGQEPIIGPHPEDFFSSHQGALLCAEAILPAERHAGALPFLLVALGQNHPQIHNSPTRLVFGLN